MNVNTLVLLSSAMDNLPEGLAVSAIGIVIVMAVLIIISVILTLLKYINPEVRNSKKKVNDAEIKKEAQKPVVQAAPNEVQQDNTELIAVITAAIAASLNTSSDNLVVRSIRKVPKWNNNAIINNHNNF